MKYLLIALIVSLLLTVWRWLVDDGGTSGDEFAKLSIILGVVYGVSAIWHHSFW